MVESERTIDELHERIEDQAALKEQIRQLENEKLRLNADVEILRSTVERLEVDNKQFRDEYDFRHSQQIREMKLQYEDMERAYNEMANSTDELKKFLNISKQDL